MTAPRIPLQATGDIDLTGDTLRDATKLPAAERARIRRNVEKMQAANAPPSHIEAYLRDVEKLAPQQHGVGRDFGDAPLSGSDAFVAGAAKGATLGFADEALGAIDAANQFLPKALGGEGVPLTHTRTLSDLVTGKPGTGGLPAFTQRYQQSRDKTRQVLAQASQQHPVATTAGDITGGVLTALPVAAEGAIAKVAGKPALTLGRQIAVGAGQAAKVGAAYGAVAGAGNADGALTDRAIGAATGGAIGGGLGIVLGGLSPVAGKALTELRDLIGRRQIAAGTKAAMDAREAVLSSITDPAERKAVEAFIANDNILGPAFNGTDGAAPVTASGPRLKARTGAIGGLPPGRTSDHPFLKSIPGRPQGGSALSGEQQALLDRVGVQRPDALAMDQPTPAGANPPMPSDAEKAAILSRAGVPLSQGGTKRIGAISIRSGNGMTQDVGGSADERANEKLLEVLNRDQQSPASIRAAYQKSKAEGNTPLNLMDLSGENAQGLGRAARAAPSTAKNLIPKVLEARGKEAESRVIGRLIETTGQGRRINLTQSIDQMAEERAKDAEKLYAPIRDVPVDVPEIADALKMDDVKKAYAHAQAIAKRRAGAQKLLGAGDGTAKLPPYADLFDESGALKKPLTLGQLDQIKRGMDDMLEKGPRDPLESGGLGREGTGSLRELKNAYVQVLDNAVPGYAEARQTFAGHSSMMKAFDAGKSLFTKSPDEMQALMADMSQAEQDAFRKGAVEALSQRIEGVTPGNSLSLRVADKTRDRQRLRLLFPDEDSYNAFRASIAQEALAHATKTKVLGNSATVDKLAEFADLAGVDLGAVFQQASQPSSMIERGVKAIAGAAKNRSMASKADALAPKLLASGQSLERVLANLEAASQRLASKQATRTARTTAAGVGVTGTTRRPKAP